MRHRLVWRDGKFERVGKTCLERVFHVVGPPKIGTLIAFELNRSERAAGTHEAMNDRRYLIDDQAFFRRSPVSGGATFSTSSTVVMPAATFRAPEIRSGFMPSR